MDDFKILIFYTAQLKLHVNHDYIAYNRFKINSLTEQLSVVFMKLW